MTTSITTTIIRYSGMNAAFNFNGFGLSQAIFTGSDPFVYYAGTLLNYEASY